MPRTLIAAASDVAAEAGRQVADAGGNAVDAAIAATVASMTTELGIVSPGGGAFITVWPEHGQPVVIDAYAEMPGRGREPGLATDARRVSMLYGGGMETVVGWGSVATPGAFAGFDLASTHYGTAPWAELLAPSIDLADNGFSVTPSSGYYLGYSHRLIYGWDEETAAVYHRSDGSPVNAGDVVTNRPLANTLEALAAEHAALLYHGDLGSALVEASESRGGLLTALDLSEYVPIVRTPTRVALHGWDVATNAPPAVGGITVAALVRLVEKLGIDDWSARSVAAYAAAQYGVFSFRRTDLDGDVDRFVAADMLLNMAANADLSAMHRSPSTVHVSAVDSSGMGCAITSSAGYGSGAVIPGTGFGLNNSLGEIELTSEGFHALDPGQRLLSNMAPTVARGPKGETLAIGSPGADRITSAIVSVLLNYVVCGMDLDASVKAPRIHAEMFEGVPTLAVEANIDSSLVTDLAVRQLGPLAMYFGGVQAASVDRDGTMHGAADPRRTGAVAIGGTDV
ncbi:MAG: gamma-glutamyltransferase [Acidimicrobiia bacterium]|nr:gamma-glutamyltransferase [Acidimicrobiia bacterium]